LVFRPDLSFWGLCEPSGDAPFKVFKDRPVLIQTQSSVTVGNCLILQMDVWSQANIVDPNEIKKTSSRAIARNIFSINGL